MKAIEDYFKARRDILNYFGYVDPWIDRSIEDYRGYFWRVDGDNITYSVDDRFDFGDTYNVYSGRIIGEIMAKSDFTMIVVDTECDGNQFLQIFDNKKRVE